MTDDKFVESFEIAISSDKRYNTFVFPTGSDFTNLVTFVELKALLNQESNTNFENGIYSEVIKFIKYDKLGSSKDAQIMVRLHRNCSWIRS